MLFYLPINTANIAPTGTGTSITKVSLALLVLKYLKYLNKHNKKAYFHDITIRIIDPPII